LFSIAASLHRPLVPFNFIDLCYLNPLSLLLLEKGRYFLSHPNIQSSTSDFVLYSSNKCRFLGFVLFCSVRLLKLHLNPLSLLLLEKGRCFLSHPNIQSSTSAFVLYSSNKCRFFGFILFCSVRLLKLHLNPLSLLLLEKERYFTSHPNILSS
jgi:hypothetical protein